MPSQLALTETAELFTAAPYTRGRMQPYTRGATTELAGRGLYGDHALFIRARILSVGGSEGLHLDKIDDILLRLDYVSVAKN